jgi:dynein heavy chain
VKGFLKILFDLNAKFEYIQKQLNQFLESKRKQFPRFYFLSNEDLLEIIGMSKDPRPIQPHIGKMFEGVQELVFGDEKTIKTFEIQKLKASDGEEVDITHITVENNVESWLNILVKNMRDALKKTFFNFHRDHMNSTKKQYEKDKLRSTINSNLGQVLITAAQMQWSAEVEASLT